MKKILYRERRFIDRFSCVDTARLITLYRTFTKGGLLYGYCDRFNIVAIALEDIISITDIA